MRSKCSRLSVCFLHVFALEIANSKGRNRMGLILNDCADFGIQESLPIEINITWWRQSCRNISQWGKMDPTCIQDLLKGEREWWMNIDEVKMSPTCNIQLKIWIPLQMPFLELCHSTKPHCANCRFPSFAWTQFQLIANGTMHWRWPQTEHWTHTGGLEIHSSRFLPHPVASLPWFPFSGKKWKWNHMKSPNEREDAMIRLLLWFGTTTTTTHHPPPRLYMHSITAPRKPVKEKGSEETPPQSKTFLAFPTSNGSCLTEGIAAF